MEARLQNNMMLHPSFRGYHPYNASAAMHMKQYQVSFFLLFLSTMAAMWSSLVVLTESEFDQDSQNHSRIDAMNNNVMSQNDVTEKLCLQTVLFYQWPFLINKMLYRITDPDTDSRYNFSSIYKREVTQFSKVVIISGPKGVLPGHGTLKGPNYFVLTYKISVKHQCRDPYGVCVLYWKC